MSQAPVLRAAELLNKYLALSLDVQFVYPVEISWHLC